MLLVTFYATIGVFVLIFVFAFHYRQRPGRKPTQIDGSHALEATWTILPLGAFMLMFLWGATIYVAESKPPANAMEIYTVAKQWMWKFEHPEGVREIDQLHVPVGRDIRLTMVSQDEIHSFYVPAFRVKQDVLPGRYTTAWFRAIKPGTYHLFCAEYCGTSHSAMIGDVVVMDPAEFEQWLGGGPAQGTMAQRGQQLFASLGCATCHRLDTQGRGPNLQGVYGKPVLLDDGRTVLADDNYVRESILSPGAKVVAGFKPIMPTFQGIVSEEQLLSLIAYVKSLGQAGPGMPATNQPTAQLPGPGPNPGAKLPPDVNPRPGTKKVQ